MTEKLDREITTVGDFRFATQSIVDEKTQLYVQLDNSSSLIEITEIQLNLPKTKNQKPFLVLRCI